MGITRDRNLRLSLSDEELEMAHALAESEGTNVADLLRRYIRKAHAKKLGGKRAISEGGR